MNVKFFAQIFCSHSRAFQVPTRETHAPRRFPTHNMLRRCFFPECKIHRTAFLTLSVKVARSFEQFVDIPPGKYAVMVVFVVFFHIEIHRTIALISISGIQNFFNKLYLFHNMAGRFRLDAWRKHIQHFHRFMIAKCVIINYFHRFEFFDSGFFPDFILAFVGIIFQMAYIGNIPYVANFVAEIFQIPEQNIKSDCGTCMPQMRIAIHGRSAHIHTHVRCMERDKLLF